MNAKTSQVESLSTPSTKSRIKMTEWLQPSLVSLTVASRLTQLLCQCNAAANTRIVVTLKNIFMTFFILCWPKSNIVQIFKRHWNDWWAYGEITAISRAVETLSTRFSLNILCWALRRIYQLPFSQQAIQVFEYMSR